MGVGSTIDKIVVEIKCADRLEIARETDQNVSALEITIYTKAGCHLCEEAMTAITPLLQEFSAAVREIDIAGDPILLQRFGCEIPVIYIGRKKAAKYRVNLVQFRRQLEEAHEVLKTARPA
jgi:glutaredoxin